MRVLLVLASVTNLAHAEPTAAPETQVLTCPNDADSCELDIAGKLVYSRRGELAKWNDLRISTILDGKRTLVYASINIPHRARLRLKAGTRYRFKVAAHKPFGALDLWVIEAKRL
jgi:hypothetical protein